MNDEFSCCSYQEARPSRRGLLRGTVGVLGGGVVAATYGSAYTETAYAATGQADRILVVLSLRGAADGLSLVVPHADPAYYAARPSIAVPKAQLLGANSFFGLHPSLAPLMSLWNGGKMAAVHATGQQVTTRSHFVAMEEVEDADPGSSERVGWLNRLVGLRQDQQLLQAVQLGSGSIATHLTGPASVMASPSVEALRLAGPTGNGEEARRDASLLTLWQNAGGHLGRAAQEAISVSAQFKPVRDSAKSTLTYPRGDLGEALAATARTLKANVGAEIITVDQGSWDHHQWIGNLADGNLKRKADELAQALATFYADLGSLADKVTLVTISEFGRRVKENANQGLDHGHGNVMFIMGAGVKGGYYGTWPGLTNSVEADLPVTTDYRTVLAEIVQTLYPERSLATIFPNFTYKKLGFMHSLVVTPPPVTQPTTPAPPVAPPPPPAPAPPLRNMSPGLLRGWTARSVAGRKGATLKPSMPILSHTGKQRVNVDVRWIVNGKTVVKATSLKMTPSFVGKKVSVVVTLTAPGFKKIEKGATWGPIKG